MSQHKHTKLGQWFATAICGNDILSSALYVSGFAIQFAGIYAPLVLAGIGFVLFLYKFVYTEVVEALPVNGGAYNCLLNGTSKIFAALAGVLTILSYVATAVLSAKVGVEYLNRIIPDSLHHIHLLNGDYEVIIPETIIILLIFALLVINGLKDSAKVAFGIFALHVFTLSAVIILGLYQVATHGIPNQWAQTAVHTTQIINKVGGTPAMIYLAFSACLLGVSGFESSANFVEEQKKGVFRKTLRNMLIGVTIFNPLIALVSLFAMPYVDITAAKDFLIAEVARVIGGEALMYLVVIDAFLVLCGAVLTSFVGIGGLVHRMAIDDCLPNWLAHPNAKGAFPRIMIGFFLFCTSILIVTKGNLASLGGVYAIAFLSVMTMFALGNLILKETRTELKRTYRAPVLIVIAAMTSTFIGILGNVKIDPQNLNYFEIYFIPTFVIVLGVIYKDGLVKFFLWLTQNNPQIQTFLHNHFENIIQGTYIVFLHHTKSLHHMLDYVNKNETGWNIIVVHCHDDIEGGDEQFREMQSLIPLMQKMGFFPHFNIETHQLRQRFGPETIHEVAQRFHVNKNRILIGAIKDYHKFNYSELEGVRIIA